MKKLVNRIPFLILALLATSVAHAADHAIDPTHSSVEFKIRHLVGKVKGGFKDFDGEISFDEKALDKSKAKFTIKTASINTENEKRDAHLKSADFFDAEKFPTITFESKSFAKAGKGKFKVVGDLTMHGVTKPVTMEVEYAGTEKDPWGNTRAGFTATTDVKRKDFGIVWNKTLDSGSVMLGDDVAISIQLEAIQKAVAAAKAAEPAKK